MEKIKPESCPAAQRLTAIVDGDELFHSRGLSVVKVTRDGQTALLEIPIRSAGVSELMDELSRRAPRPPVKRELVRRDSPEGRALRLSRDTVVRMPDLSDESYQQALAGHEREFVWAVAVQALDLKFKDRQGGAVDDPERKRQMLQAAGLTREQLARIVRDVRDLTRLADEETDFLSGNALA